MPSNYTQHACGCIDIHTHVVPRDFPPYLGSKAGVRWPTMAPAKPCHRHVMLDGKVYRTVSHQAWDSQVRLEDMQRLGVERQVLSPMPELLSYWLDADDGAAMSRFLNEGIAEMAASAPGRYVGLGAVPLQDVERAIAELDHLMHQLGLAGAEIGSNVDGVPIGDVRFEPFFTAAEQWGASIFVHPLRPSGMDRLVGPPILQQALAFPGEIGLAAASLITGGTLARHPRLRIAFSHGGGSLQALIPRLQQAWEILPALAEAVALAPREAARMMYYDDLLYDAGAIENLVRLCGPTQVMIGTDYPFSIRDKDPAGRVSGLDLSEEIKDALRFGNALRWLGMAPSQTAASISSE